MNNTSFRIKGEVKKRELKLRGVNAGLLQAIIDMEVGEWMIVKNMSYQGLVSRICYYGVSQAIRKGGNQLEYRKIDGDNEVWVRKMEYAASYNELFDDVTSRSSSNVSS